MKRPVGIKTIGLGAAFGQRQKIVVGKSTFCSPFLSAIFFYKFHEEIENEQKIRGMINDL